MKRLFTLLLLSIVMTTGSFGQGKLTDISGPMELKGELKREYKEAPAGTPVVVRRLVDVQGTNLADGIYYGVEINGIQHSVSIEEFGAVRLLPPQTDREFWQKLYLEDGLYTHYYRKGYDNELRREVEDECAEYLKEVEEIAYDDDFLTSYVQGVFAKLNAVTIDPKRSEALNVRIIQTPEPDAYMLPNGSMLVSTGLISVLDSEDELAAVMACELGHFVYDHQLKNIRRAEARGRWGVFWGDVLASVADEFYYDAVATDDNRRFAASFVADLASIATYVNVPVVNRLGMRYRMSQEEDADRLALNLLAFKGYNPDALSSALGKIIGYYNRSHRSKDIVRYNTLADLRKRIDKAGHGEMLTERNYQKKTSDVVTFNAAMNFANKRYSEAIFLLKKNVDNKLATTHDYVLYAQAQMALSNTEESNEACITLLDQAELLAGDSPNLDIYKQRALLMMRMNKQSKATEALNSYLKLLKQYQTQEVLQEEKEWADKEITWANQLLDKIYRI